ncbi:HEAT repeat domain-containing protein [Streptomyces sp. NPDC090025]|uniref:HEAT repeat domain-containing protein n=1 Tax=Streptomyces sp. NPDC090025 TaxID=3365922 RepID=UPI0038338CC7
MDRMDTDEGGNVGARAGETPLVAAARAGDLFRVTVLLEEEDASGHGWDDDERAAAYAAAVRAHHGGIAELLLMRGAEAGRCAPDELIPLREAVDSGSPALVGALLAAGIRDRYPAAELAELRALAAGWYETGTAAGLRRRTGSPDEPVRTRVEDDEYSTVDEFTLGGLTVRDGHAAILTELEERLGIRTPCDELVGRALAHDKDHPAWGRSAIQLSTDRRPEAWAAARTLRGDADPARRLFGAELMRLLELFGETHDEEFCVLAVAALTDWAAEETDAAVLAEVLDGLHSYAGPRAEAALLAHVGHPDAAVRRAVAIGLGTPAESTQLSDGARTALRTLLRDPDADVRASACRSVGGARSGGPALTDPLAALLDDPERRVQLAAVHALALHEDDRCLAAADRLAPARPGFRSEENASLDLAWRHRRRREGG